jgi:uncharacterized repeat protein (TIGR01451 family)
MNRLWIGVAATSLSGFLGLVAVSVAQRDARHRADTPVLPGYAVAPPTAVMIPGGARPLGDTEVSVPATPPPPLAIRPPAEAPIVRGSDARLERAPPAQPPLWSDQSDDTQRAESAYAVGRPLVDDGHDDGGWELPDDTGWDSPDDMQPLNSPVVAAGYQAELDSDFAPPQTSGQLSSPLAMPPPLVPPATGGMRADDQSGLPPAAAAPLPPPSLPFPTEPRMAPPAALAPQAGPASQGAGWGASGLGTPPRLPQGVEAERLGQWADGVDPRADNEAFDARPSPASPAMRPRLDEGVTAEANRMMAPSRLTSGSPAGDVGASLDAQVPSLGRIPSDGGMSGPASTAGGMVNLRSLAQATPGGRQYDGPQSPSLLVEKLGGDEIQVGQSTTFVTVVRNTGNTALSGVRVTDRVPDGAELVSTSPTAQQSGNGWLVWELDELPPGAERNLTVELVPRSEGEIGSVAEVTFSTVAAVRSMATLPRLQIDCPAPSQVLVGQPVQLDIEVVNSGTGTAHDLQAIVQVPHGMRHPEGEWLTTELGQLAPGQRRRVSLELVAVEPGTRQCTIEVRGPKVTSTERRVDWEVIAPKLEVSLVGPRRRYLERRAQYQVVLRNTGTATAENPSLVVYLPRGVQFTNASNFGEHNEREHFVRWELEELAAGATAVAELSVIPFREGEQIFKVQSQAVGARAEPAELKMQVEGQSELVFSLGDDADPVEVGGQTRYHLQIGNQGTRPDHDIGVSLVLPEGAKLLHVDAPVDYQLQGNRLQFRPLPMLEPKQQADIRVTLEHAAEGVQILRAELTSRLRPVAVIKEESTKVYRDD